MSDLKRCPVCHASCFADMEICYGCLHRFTNDDRVCACDFEPEQPSTLQGVSCSNGLDLTGRDAVCRNELPSEDCAGVDVGGCSDGSEYSSYVEIEALLRIPQERIVELCRSGVPVVS